MNRSILIVICDFLLLSLLAFSSVDINQVTKPGEMHAMSNALTPTAAPVGGKQDLGDVMRLALTEEQKNRENLAAELNRTRSTLGEQQAELARMQNQLATKEQAEAQLTAAQAKLLAEHNELQGQLAAAQTNMAALNEQLHATSAENVITQEQRAAMEAEARKQAERAAALEQQLAELQKTNQAMLSDQQSLQTELKLAEAAHRSAVAQAAQLQEEVDAQRQENARLANGVQVLAAKSTELANEIQETRELTPNTIFQDISTNRVSARFIGVRPGVFGDTEKERQAQLLLVTDGTNTFALGHVEDTPFTFWNPGTKWEELGGTLSHPPGSMPIPSLSFSLTDPRVVLVPVTAAQAASLGCQVYHLSKNPYVFQDAVVVGTRGDYYGECKFEIDVTTPEYLKMDRSSIQGLFGKFEPSSGDLVLSKRGELLGVMANNSYCAVIHNFTPAATLRFGPDGRNQETDLTLANLYSAVTALPFKLQ